MLRSIVAALTAVLLLSAGKASAHPLFTKFYERTVTVRLAADPAGRVTVRVEYLLELNSQVALLDANRMLRQAGQEPPGSFREYYDAFMRLHGPVLADRLYAGLDDKALEFVYDEPSPDTHPWEEVKKDGTLRCTFRFRAAARPKPGDPHTFTFDEGTYKEEAGLVRLSLVAESPVVFLTKDEPSAELKARPPEEWKDGDEERLRQASATFTLSASPAPAPTSPPADTREEEAPAARHGLLDLLLDTRQGFAALLLLSAAFGAFHALTPGHGKTLVAAYLVGERGTVLHALFLGVVTTLTHTGAVLAIAAVLWFFPEARIAHVQKLLGLVGGLLVASMGFWLLYRRVAGQADHFHLGGGHHHHHHDHHGPAQAPPAGKEPVGWWNLIILGVSGGIVPCTDAIVMLVIAVGKGWLDRALPLLLAFSAGLAFVLIAIGVLVVTSKRFAGGRFGEGRLFRALPVVSAVLIIGLGLWLCYDTLHGGMTPR